MFCRSWFIESIPVGGTGTSTGGVGSTSDSTTGGASIGPLDESGDSSSSGAWTTATDSTSGSTGPEVRTCFAEEFPEVDLCWGAPTAEGCVCDEQCQWSAASLG